MQGIYTYIPEKNNVPKEYNVAAILSLLSMAAFPKLWSADHRWFSGSALVVLLD
jgi:hypothetical protein